MFYHQRRHYFFNQLLYCSTLNKTFQQKDFLSFLKTFGFYEILRFPQFHHKNFVAQKVDNDAV